VILFDLFSRITCLGFWRSEPLSGATIRRLGGLAAGRQQRDRLIDAGINGFEKIQLFADSAFAEMIVLLLPQKLPDVGCCSSLPEKGLYQPEVKFQADFMEGGSLRAQMNRQTLKRDLTRMQDGSQTLFAIIVD